MEDENGEPFVYPYFIHDSYDFSDIINRIEWEKSTDADAYPINNLTREYTTGLIELRRSTDAFRLGDKALVDSNVTLVDAPEIADQDLVIAYRNEATNGDPYYVFINADTNARTLTLAEDLTDGVVLVDNDEAGTTAVTEKTGFELTSDSITIDPLSIVVIKVKKVLDISPMPTNPTQPDETKEEIIVNQPQADVEGKIAITIGNGSKQVKIPAHAEAVNRNNKLCIDREDLTMEVPGTVLESLKKLGKGDSGA